MAVPFIGFEKMDKILQWQDITDAMLAQGNRMSFMPELSGTENPRPKQPSVVLA